MTELIYEKAGETADRLLRAIGQRHKEDIMPLKISGSARRYFRIFGGGQTYIMCVSDNTRENSTFIKMTRYFERAGIKVGKIVAVLESGDAYLMEDLGDTDLMSLIKTGKDCEELWSAIEGSILMLVDLQSLPEEEWKDKVEFAPLAPDLIKYDFQYAINNFFSAAGVEYDGNELAREFDSLEKRLMACPEEMWGLMYRDFQSRNIMVKEGRPYFIDYQSARKGPGIYDLVSFAWQAKAGFTVEERERIVEIYIKARAEKGKEIGTTIRKELPYWATFRILQTLGAYGLRGLKEGKAHFKESIPPALHNLHGLLESGLNKEMPELAKIVGRLLEEGRFDSMAGIL